MAIMVLVLGILAVVANTMEIPEELLETERMAFSLCDSDRMVGLTWREVAKCEVDKSFHHINETYFS